MPIEKSYRYFSNHLFTKNHWQSFLFLPKVPIFDEKMGSVNSGWLFDPGQKREACNRCSTLLNACSNFFLLVNEQRAGTGQQQQQQPVRLVYRRLSARIPSQCALIIRRINLGTRIYFNFITGFRNAPVPFANITDSIRVIHKFYPRGFLDRNLSKPCTKFLLLYRKSLSV